MSLALFFQHGRNCVFDIPVLKRLRLGEPTAEDKTSRSASPAEVSWSIRRNLGRSWRETSLACCGDQRRKETRRFPVTRSSTSHVSLAVVEI